MIVYNFLNDDDTLPVQVEGPVPDSMISIVSSSVKGSLSGAATSSAEPPSRPVSTAETGSHRSGVAAAQPSSVVESRSSQDWKAVKAGIHLQILMQCTRGYIDRYIFPLGLAN